MLRFARNDTPMAQATTRLATFQTRSQKRTRSVSFSWCHLFSPPPRGSGLSGCDYTQRDNGRIRLGILWGGAMSPPFHPATRKGISAVSGCRLPTPATLWKPRAAYLSPSLSLDIFDQDYITAATRCQLKLSPVSGEVHGSFAPLGQVCVRALLAK